VLVLSEFTGAADELGKGALLCNPHDIDGLKEILMRAAQMEPREMRRRMRRLRRVVMEHDVAAWARSFLNTLEAVPEPGSAAAAREVAAESLEGPDAETRTDAALLETARA